MRPRTVASRPSGRSSAPSAGPRPQPPVPPRTVASRPSGRSLAPSAEALDGGNRGGTVGLLARDGPCLAPVARPTNPAGRVVRAVIDSGAEDTVAPPDVLPGAVRPSAMSRAGLAYRSANGLPIRNLGQQTVAFRDDQQRRSGMHFQVAEVDRPLISVARLVDAGNRVVFEPSGGSITHVATGRSVQLLRDGNVYALDMHIPPALEEEEEQQRRPVEVTLAADAAACPAASAAAAHEASVAAAMRPVEASFAAAAAAAASLTPAERRASGFARPER